MTDWFKLHSEFLHLKFIEFNSPKVTHYNLVYVTIKSEYSFLTNSFKSVSNGVKCTSKQAIFALCAISEDYAWYGCNYHDD